MNFQAWFVFVLAATLEVGGDAVIRRGLKGAGLGIVALGALMLGLYGVTVNLVKWDFSKLLGVYVAVFAVVSLLFGVFFFKEAISSTRWLGLAIIVMGSLVMQFSR